MAKQRESARIEFERRFATGQGPVLRLLGMHGQPTCRKSQGSQWGSVLVVDDWRFNDRAKWLYTAITRASHHVTIYNPRNR